MNVPNEELFNNLLNIWQKLGKQPSSKNLKNYGSIYSRNLYENKFGSWNNALKAFIDHINNNNLNVSSFDKAESKVIASNRTPRDINWRLRAKILIRDNCICQMCGASPAKKPDVELHVDHIYPYSKGGETVEENLRTLCIQCNIGKSDMVIEYIANRG
jgi:predicted phosphoadenosine phosphosulfate sulfurtransferase